MTFLVMNSILAIIGIVISHKIYREKGLSRNVCVGKCDYRHALYSKFSKFLHIDLEYLGLVYHAIILLGHLYLIFSGQTFSAAVLISLLVLSGGGLLFSMYLAFIQMFYIKKFCGKCSLISLLSVLIFSISFIGVANAQVDIYGLINLNEGFIRILYMVGIGLGVGSVTFLDILTLRFLRDLKIDQNESTKLKILNEVSWVAMFIVFISLLGYDVMGLLSKSAELGISFLILLIIIINSAILNLFIGPKLIGVNLEKVSIGVNKMYWLRQIAFSLSAISLVSWYSILYLSITKTSYNTFEAFSGYLVAIIIGIVMGQIIPLFFRRNQF